MSPDSAQHDDDDDDDDDDDGHVIAPVLSEAEPRGTGMVDRSLTSPLLQSCPTTTMMMMMIIFFPVAVRPCD
jgi:hypothetical protein